jgi:hypothetical protein
MAPRSGYKPAMISVLVRVEHGVEALAVTLSALVPAVAEGLVGDAVVMVRKPDPAVEAVADAVGATLLVEPEGSWRAGASIARREWVLCLTDGDVPSEGWIRVLERFIALSPPERRFGRLARRRSVLSGVWTALENAFAGRQVRDGDLVHRSVFAQRSAPRPARVGAQIERDPVFG